MNSFQAACCRSHLLLRPGVGNPARDVVVPVMVVGRGWGGGVKGERRGDRRQGREFSQHPPLSRPGPLEWAVGLGPDSGLRRWSGIKTSSPGALGVSARERGRGRKKGFKDSGR